MLGKLTRSLTEDVDPLLPAGVRFGEYDAIDAFGRVWKELIVRIKGDAWKLTVGKDSRRGLVRLSRALSHTEKTMSDLANIRIPIIEYYPREGNLPRPLICPAGGGISKLSEKYINSTPVLASRALYPSSYLMPRLDETHACVGEHECRLPHAHTGPPCQSPVDVRHDGSETFLAHQHAADFLAVVVECIEYRNRAAAGHAKHEIDPRLLEDARDRLRHRYFIVTQRLCGHARSRMYVLLDL